MSLVQIWDIVWDSEPFHWATLAVLFVAVIFECYGVWQYWHSKCGTTAAAIEFLSNLSRVPRDRSVQLPQPPKQIRSWLQNYLGNDNSSRLWQQAQQNEKFILIKYPDVLARPIPRSSLRFVTTLCTAIGVLGTFYGIQEGLQGINLDTTSFEQLLPAIKQLLTGMKTAFSTSLMGLGSGSLFTLVLFGCDLGRQQRRDSLRQQLDAIAIFKTTDNDISRVATEFQRVAERLTNFNFPSAEAIGQAVGRSIAEEFVGLNQLSSEAIGQAVGEQMRSVILPALQAIFQQQRILRELQENQGQRVLEELIQDLRVEVLEPIASRLDESARLTQQASEAVLTLHESLASSIVAIQNFQEDTLGKLEIFAQNLGQTLSQFQTDTKGVLEETAQQINSAVKQSIQGMTAQRTAFEESANQAAATFRGIREELQKALEERAEVEQQMLQATQTKIEEILNTADAKFRQQTHTLRIVGDQASGLMNEAKEHLLATLGNINETLTETREIVKEDLTNFREEYQENLKQFFTEQNQLLEGTLGEHRDGLAQVVTNLNNVFQEEYQRRSHLSEEVNKIMNTILEAAQDVNKLTIATGLNDNQRWQQMKLLASDIGKQVENVEKSYHHLNSKFDHSLMTWQKHLESSMQQTVNLQESFFQQADDAMAKVCGSLLETAKVLVAVKDNNDINGSNHHG